jgi:tetratricopeptide (TPR) repeat protein
MDTGSNTNRSSGQSLTPDEAAVRVLEQLIGLAPDDAEAMRLLAEALRQAGRAAESLAWCKKAKAITRAGLAKADGGAGGQGFVLIRPRAGAPEALDRVDILSCSCYSSQ